MGEHTHKYKRVKFGGTKIFKCVLPNCPHWLPNVNLIVGREHTCWRCGNIVVVTPQMSKQAKPHCRDCKWEHVGVAGREAIEKKGAA